MAEIVVCWDTHPNGDPYTKVRAEQLVGRHVVLLFGSDTPTFFRELGLFLFLQRFVEPLPLPEYAEGKWKASVADGQFVVRRVASITVVMPWMRHGRSERVSRFAVEEGKWTNSAADGPFLELPSIGTICSLLSALPVPAPALRGAPALPPIQFLTLCPHELDALEAQLDASGRWANQRRPSDDATQSGTYHIDPTLAFFETVLKPALARDGASKFFVVFPDAGAFARLRGMARSTLPGLPTSHILYIPKKRVGSKIVHEEVFYYLDEAGERQAATLPFPSGASFTMPDDFTASGSSAFGAAQIIRRHAEPGAFVRAFFCHFILDRDPSRVPGFLDKVYGADALLDEFHCSDSVFEIVECLKSEAAKRVGAGRPQKVFVLSSAPTIAEWIRSNPVRERNQWRNGLVVGIVAAACVVWLKWR